MTMPTDVAAAVERLEQYNLGQYDEVTNPFGLSGIGGMDANWERHNADMALVANWLAGAVDGVDDGAAAAAQSVIDAAGEVALAVLAKGQAEAARDAAQEARDLAGQYRDEALGAVGGVLVSGGDTTPAPLGTKLTVSPGLTKSTTSPGGNEALNLAVDFASDAEAATGTATAKAVTPAALKGWVPALTEITGGNVDPAADFIPIYDASGAVVRKVKPNNLGITSGMTNPMTTAGDLIVGGSGGTPTRLAVGANGQILAAVDGQLEWVAMPDISYVRLDSVSKDPNVTLSDNNRTMTVTGSGTDGGVRTTKGTAVAKIYLEVKLNAGGTGNWVGVQRSTDALDNYLGTSSTSFCYRGTGEKRTNNTNSSFGATLAAGDVVGVALDMGAGKVWFAKNGVWQASGNPAAGTGQAFSGLSGEMYIALYGDGISGDATKSMTLRLSAADWSYTAPAGFNAFVI